MKLEQESHLKDTRSVRSLTGRLDWSVVLLAFYLACIYVVQPRFFSSNNLWALVYYTCLLTPAVLGVHVLIVLGLFDLSVGAIAAVCGVLAAKAMMAGMPIAISMGIGILFGGVFGLLNWLLVVVFRISALIATLISLGIARAISLGITQGLSIGGLPDSFGNIALGSPGSLSPAIVLGICLVLAVEFLTQRHVLFRRLYHVGSNSAAAASSGINVKAMKLFGFVLAGIGAGMAGLLQASRTQSASPFLFPDLAFECIAACVIGGASLSGGTGRAAGAFFGMLMVVISRNLVVMAGVSIYWKELGIALILLAAVLLKMGERKA